MFLRSLRLSVCAVAFIAVAFVVGCEEEKEAAVTQTETKQAAPAAKVAQPKRILQAPKPVATPKEANASAGSPRVKLQTSKGDIVIELNAAKAPVTVKNFLGYVNEGHYSGKIFHRVIKGFMIQGGNFDVNMKRAVVKAPIVNEGKNGLKNVRGAIAMARTNSPNSATDQFYICDKDNPFLNAAPGKAGYAVFGKVVEGMDVVDAIASVKTGARDVPVTPVIIMSAKVVK